MSAPKFLGGYLVDHISLHCDLFLLKPVMKYIKFRVQNIDLTCDLYFVEYHIGIQLSRWFQMKVNNCTPHTANPCKVYSHIFGLIKVVKN